jgi:gamma-butyrobetaine dioxygenase
MNWSFRMHTSISYDVIKQQQSNITEVLPGERAVSIRWDDGHVSRFHWIWLRHNCRCDKCWNNQGEQTRQVVVDIPQDIAPASAMVDNQGRLVITWAPDGHVTDYAPGWLRAHCYSALERNKRRHRPTLWDSGFASSMPIFDRADVQVGNLGNLQLLERLRDYGVARMRGAALTTDEIERLAELIGFVRETNYGRFLDVITKPSAKILAYTSEYLSVHTDDPYRDLPPAFGMFHCLSADSTGGDSILVDGFKIAETLRKEHPEAFDILSRIPQQYSRYHEDDVDFRYEARMISTDYWAEVSGFRYADRPLAPLDIEEDYVEAFYDAFRKLTALTRRSEFEIRFRLVPGDVLLFDNHRVLHGRTGLSGGRHLRTCYFEREVFRSRLRVLGRKFGHADYNLTLAGGAMP